ncbi:MAG: transglycosylase SLT domain-containing protein [Desulfobacteraceae bacterium]|jgi:hypothetical protein
MSSTDLRDQKSGLKNDSTKMKMTGESQVEPARKDPSAKTKSVRQWIYKGTLVFIMLVLIGLQSLALMWLSRERVHNRMVAAQVERIQTDIIDLRSLVDANIVEDLIFLKILVLNPRVSNQTAREIASAIYKNALRYNKDPDLILSIVSIESGFDPAIISNAGAIGLMQVMPQWIDVLDIQCDLKDPDCNIRYGIQILGAYQQLYGDLYMALTAYNRGPGPVDYALMKGKNPDNGYAGKVQAVYNRLRAISRTNQKMEVAYSDR